MVTEGLARLSDVESGHTCKPRPGGHNKRQSLKWGTGGHFFWLSQALVRTRAMLEVVLFLYVTGCESSRSKALPDWEERRWAFPQQEAHRFRLTWISGDGGRGLLMADSLWQQLYRDTLWWFLRGQVRAEWGMDRQTMPNRLFCEQAQVLPQSGLLRAYRSVRLESATGEILETDELWWDRSSGRLWAPGWVRLQTPKEEIRGWGLESANTLRTYKLRRIQGRVQAPAI